jgi:8-oxo-dGTP pyrophosphatase MutT (NUDIX family)
LSAAPGGRGDPTVPVSGRDPYDRGVPDLPPTVADRAVAFSASSGAPAPVRDASTVVLLRDGEAPGAGLEVCLLRRVASMAFAAGMYVFPGGTVDPRDAEQGIAWGGPPPGEWARSLGCSEALARGLVCAAVRETFEESGVLLAGPPGAGRPEVVGDTTGPDWEADRLALVDRRLSFADLLARRSLCLRTELLRPWAQWVTPEFEPRRFDARFFVAAVPAGQRTRDVGGEADRVGWLPVRAAVQAYEAGSLAMLHPTIATLRGLVPYSDVATVLRAERRLHPVRPRAVVDAGGGVRLVVEGPHGDQPADREPAATT